MIVTVALEVGDVVHLKSDVCLDTLMTVEDITDNGCEERHVDVVWINELGEVHRDSFVESCLSSIE